MIRARTRDRILARFYHPKATLALIMNGVRRLLDAPGLIQYSTYSSQRPDMTGAYYLRIQPGAGTRLAVLGHPVQGVMVKTGLAYFVSP